MPKDVKCICGTLHTGGRDHNIFLDAWITMVPNSNKCAHGYLNQIFLFYHTLNCSTFGNELGQYLQGQI